MRAHGYLGAGAKLWKNDRDFGTFLETVMAGRDEKG
jgi:hypothetical protein